MQRLFTVECKRNRVVDSVANLKHYHCNSSPNNEYVIDIQEGEDGDVNSSFFRKKAKEIVYID